MAGATFRQQLISGMGDTKRVLGPNQVLGFFVNGMEMQFNIDPNARMQYSALAVRQWAGPEAHWIKIGNPLFSPWRRVPAPPPGGPDDPDPGNVVDMGAYIAFFDSPGPNQGNALYAGASRIQVIQNFTTWIEGTSYATGQPVGLSDPVAAWFSVVDIADSNWDGSADGGSAWGFTGATTVGLGWRDATNAPVI